MRSPNDERVAAKQNDLRSSLAMTSSEVRQLRLQCMQLAIDATDGRRLTGQAHCDDLRILANGIFDYVEHGKTL